MSEVKIVLKRSPIHKDNGVWIDGVKLEGVQEVSVYGAVRQIPHVVIKLIPKTLVLGVEDPDIDQSQDVKVEQTL